MVSYHFIPHLLIVIDWGTSFHMFICHVEICDEVSVQAFCLVLNQKFLINLKNPLYILGVSHILALIFANIFF